jgi:hypothetical protein
MKEALIKPEVRGLDALYAIKMYPINIRSKTYE